jgi:hypothetical protein
MKRLLGLSLIPLLSLTGIAQDTTRHDPLRDVYGGHPVLANSVELVLMTDSVLGAGSRAPAVKVVDVNGTGQLVGDDRKGIMAIPFDGGMYADAISDDFDGDGAAEIITAQIYPTGGPSSPLLIERWRPARQKPGYTWQWADRETLLTSSTYNGWIRLHSVHLDYTTDKQLVVCGTIDAAVMVSTYSMKDHISLIGSQYYDGGGISDYGFGDFDGDGLHELLRVAASFNGTENRVNFGAAKFNATSKRFVDYGWQSSYRLTSGFSTWKRFKLITGDFRHLGYDEAVLSVTTASGNNGLQVFLYGVVNYTWMFANAFPGTAPSGSAWGNGWEGDAFAVDLNPLKGDGDELVVAGPGGIGILKFDGSLNPYYVCPKVNLLHPAALENTARRRFVAVGDIDPDTSSRTWVNEIIVAEHNQDSTTVLRVFQPTLNGSNTITGLTQTATYSPAKKSSKSELVVGDLDGDGMRFGTPNLVTVESFYQPIVMLGVPPTHFDDLHGQPYDICNVYGPTKSEFKVTYTESQGTTTHFQSEVTHSWGASAEISGGFEAFGFKVKAYAKSSYDRGYYGSHSADTSFTTTSFKESTGDDWILATVSDLDFWEYPIHAIGRKIGTFLVQIPRLRGTDWVNNRNVIARNWMADREVGNLLSYLPSTKVASWAGGNLLTTFQGQYISQASAGGFSLNLGTQSIDSNKLTNKVKAEVGLQIKKWGCEAKVSGRYSYDAASTHSITASKNVLIDIKVSETNRAFGDADYKVTPYLYWGQNGALVVDYGVDPSSLGDSTLGTFWDKNYLTRSDPGLILPWRLDSLKGIGDTGSLRQYCKSLHVSPSAPSPGDTVHITLDIHNFSLRQTDGPVTTRFYLGDPMAGGSPIIGIGNGSPDLSTSGAVPSRETSTLEMDWVVPSGLTSSARIYAWLDPTNAINEIHEDNNIGFVSLRSAGATSVEEEQKAAIPETYQLRQNYPNPFNPSTVIQYELPSASQISLVVYDVLGRAVATLVDGIIDAGLQHVVFNAKGLASGMYFCRLEARPVITDGTVGFTSVKRMLLVR